MEIKKFYLYKDIDEKLTKKRLFIFNKNRNLKFFCLNRYKVEGYFDDFPRPQAFLYMWNQSKETLEQLKINTCVNIINLNCSRLKILDFNFVKVDFR